MPDLLKSVEDGVMKITFNRPEAMNALSRDMLTGFSDALERGGGDPATSAASWCAARARRRSAPAAT